MLLFSLASFVFAFGQKFTFGVIGENVTTNIRKKLYRNVMMKHLGWFDDRENAPGVITTTLSSDAQIINGASTEGMASIVDAVCSVVVGIGIGFYFSWRMSLVTMALCPFIAIAGYMGAVFQKGLSVDSENSLKYANILAGDAIMNYRTVASFANEGQIMKDYKDLLEIPKRMAIKQAHKIGASYGFS